MGQWSELEHFVFCEVMDSIHRRAIEGTAAEIFDFYKEIVHVFKKTSTLKSVHYIIEQLNKLQKI